MHIKNFHNLRSLFLEELKSKTINVTTLEAKTTYFNAFISAHIITWCGAKNHC